METMHDVTQLQPTRQELLALYLKRNRLSYARIGQHMGITGQSVMRLCRNDTAPSHRVAQLADLGIPVDLLPKPHDITPGPKPKATMHACA
ncbi:hypothetical protein [Nitratidesulfovibrio vulgaris]|uniref:hypothetical protein n=1 Tax=Nitratidesulfovibrio vulgaris TaxID=881 RepID=UPI0013E088FC|nr:hypothetical protein [Nitratidesulfovibrio vulgaris]